MLTNAAIDRVTEKYLRQWEALTKPNHPCREYTLLDLCTGHRRENVLTNAEWDALLPENNLPHALRARSQKGGCSQ